MDIVRLKEKLGEIADPRRSWGNLRHKLEDILVIGLATLLCNGSDFEDMEEFGLERETDMIFREDACQAGKGHAPENLNILRKMALSLLRAAENPRVQGSRKMSGPKNGSLHL